MLTASLLDDCRLFVNDIVIYSRGLYDKSFVASVIELGGDCITFLCECRESSDNSGKARLIQLSLEAFKKLLTRIELAYKAEIISEAVSNLWLKRCRSLIARLQKCLLDYKRRAELISTRLGKSDVIYSTARLDIRTPSESDISSLSQIMCELYPKMSARFSDRDYVREIIKSREYGDVFVIAHRGGDMSVGAVFVREDRYDNGRVSVDLSIMPDYRRRGYFIEALEGIVKYEFDALCRGVVGIYLHNSCRFLIDCCSRYGFMTEGIKRASDGAGDWTVMAVKRS